MPMYPEDLDHPLSRGDASLLGIGWRELSGPLWRSPYRGSHVWSVTDPADPLQRALDASLLLPDGGALGGWAAARVGGVTELDGRSGSELLPVPLCLPPNVRRRRGPHVVPWRSPVETSDVVVIGGVPVTVPVRTAFDLARTGPLTMAVTALDILGRGRPEFLAEVAKYLGDRPGWKGVPLARRSLDLATPYARSPRETALRLFWLLECGLPVPVVNAEIRSADGLLLGLGDLLDPETGLLGEYDGAQHREEIQHALDNAREEGFEGVDLTVVRVTNPDLGRFRRRTRMRLIDGWDRARRTPRGSWTWTQGALPPPVPHW